MTFTLALLSTTGCGLRVLPRAEPPPVHTVRADDEVEAPSSNESTVAIDVTHGHAKVERVLETVVTDSFGYGSNNSVHVSSFGERTEPVCETPCIVNLPRGTQELRVTDLDDPLATDVTSLHVGKKPVTMIYEPAKASPANVGGRVTAYMLEGLAITGLVLGGTGLALSQLPERDGVNPHDMFVPSIATLGGSVGGLVLGIVIEQLSRGSFRPGAATTVATR